MSVDKFGSSGSRLSKTDNKYVDKKFITLNKDLVTKLGNNGDIMDGPLNMQTNKVSSRFVPVNENDLVNLGNI